MTENNPTVSEQKVFSAIEPVLPPARRYWFGTDGVRGIANTELSPQLAMSLGAAAAQVLRPSPEEKTSNAFSSPDTIGRGGRERLTSIGQESCGTETGSRCQVIVGRDPRLSGDLLEAALTAGLCSQGVDVLTVGVVPTPGIAYLTRTLGAVAGIMVSASHNPMEDNGIKFFGSDGKKLADAVEAEIEARLPTWEQPTRPSGAGVGRRIPSEALVSTYVTHLQSLVGENGLHGMRLVIDCANGAACGVAETALTGLGAEVIALSNTPDGININDNCGSLHPEAMAARVVAENADAGLAFDGDADRVILCDGRGRIFDGDRILCTAGIYFKSQNQLSAPASGSPVVVGTVMSNLGLEKALEKHGILLIRAAVGDRYVAEQMAAYGAVLGGEKSGHILFSQWTTTGDGLLTGLQMLKICRESGRSLASWADEMQEYPQKLVSIPVRTKDGWQDVPEIAAAMREVEALLAGRGRLNVRPSGTEKKIRVMVEGPDEAEVNALTARVADAVRSALGA